jgi:uncharacterized protein (UPF0332 family)
MARVTSTLTIFESYWSRMAKFLKTYKARDVARAHHWMVKALDTLAEARILARSGQTRLGAYSRLYYSTHHMAVALLAILGKHVNSHSALRQEFGREWVKTRRFPPTYARLLADLTQERKLADYGEYVPTMERDLARRLSKVEIFIRRASREIPPISTQKILEILIDQNPDIRDFSFDLYCPKSYYHHTRFTVWSPKGRTTDKWLKALLSGGIRTLKHLRVKEAGDYVLGMNSRVNQYAEKHIIMLDFDNVSTIHPSVLKKEKGFLFRTGSGFHLIGSKLYDKVEWRKRMKAYSSVASKMHFELSMKRGYATLRLTSSPRKPQTPAFMGRSGQW